MSRHALWMILACVVPLLLIFLLPLFGMVEDSGALFFLFMIGCFAMHLLMMRGHHGDHGSGGKGGDHGEH